ncbi:hypothetical protein LTR36_002949 [Oleoguttula mirabilis]|uniref:DUF6594 domain-containing protein n=1 Tax=Oleoguttula mirabilis TaxID=1507867 RepID=A0AAV9JW47_9PEZI|nr:hypothetical protein LTR36_002949 [Oleoguttula mirabilis]
MTVKPRESTMDQPRNLQQDDEPRGYHRLAERTMGPFPQLAIFRKLGSLDMLNLLSLQAELTHLESQFKAISRRDDKSAGVASDFSVSFRAMLEERDQNSDKLPDLAESDDTQMQWWLILRIREKLNEYNSTLLQVSRVTALPKPNKHHLGLLRDSLNETDSSSSFLEGTEFLTWETINEGDLIAVNSSREEDEFTHWFNTHPLVWYHWLIGSKLSESKKGLIAAYSDSRVSRIATVITSVVSALLPVVAVLVLFYVKATHDRIYIMLGLTALFAFAIAIFTSAKHHEIFAATAAFAAVEVVFIGSVNDNRNPVTA